MPKIPGRGLVKGVGVTFKEMTKTVFPNEGAKKLKPNPSKGAVTVQYPHEKEAPATRARGVIALLEENCTVCMLCARSCPDWCIYIEGHKQKAPPRRPGGKERTVSALDRFDIDYALCMYCGICVEVCPFDALFWSPEYEYSEPRIAELLHDKERLGEWMDAVPEYEPYEAGAEVKVKKLPKKGAKVVMILGETMVAQHVAFGVIAAVVVIGALRVVTTNDVVHAALWLVAVLAGVGASFLLVGAEFVGVTQILVYIGAVVVLFLFGIMLTRAPIGHVPNLTGRNWPMGLVVALPIAGVLAYTLIDAYGTEHVGNDTRQLTADVSDTLFQNYLVPFEVLSVLLLAALIGAIVLGEEGLEVLLNEFLLLGAALFSIGVYGVLVRRNGVMVLMSIELILNAVNINFVAFGAFHHTVVGQVFALFVIAIAAAEVGVGLAIVLMLYRNRASIDLDQVDAMREGDAVILHWVWLMPALMALSFLAILFFGKRMPFRGAEIGIAAVGICFVFALLSAGSWIARVNDASGGKTFKEQVAGAEANGASESTAATEVEEAHPPVQPVVTEKTWFESGGVKFTAGTLVDGLSVMMLIVVTIISLLVHIYSTDYVGGDRRYTHYFAFLSLFTASMLMLVMSSNTVQFITSWELVGLCSFALIGHWWEDKPNSDAALKAFITNRVGDVGLLVGMITLFWAANSFDILKINTLANNGGIDHLLLLVAACCLTAAVMSKSGQFILHTWLPDAMAGPTPVSALIHAATMVVAGVFMVARLYAVFFHGFSIGDGNTNLLAVIGGVTVLGGAGLAFVQNDIKKVLAYSTVSQLGYMVMALGVGAWTAALFHLFTHAFFKAGLFLGSGSVAHSVHSFDMKDDMGGLRRFMPKTFWTFVICTVALVGIPPFAGFWSKDEILAGGHELGLHNAYETFMIVGIIGALMTAAYMTRCVYLTFFGEPRGAAADPHHHPHESGPRIVVPLYILSGLAIVAGLANFPWGADGINTRFEYFVQPVGDYFPPLAAVTFNPYVAIVSTLAGLLGILLGYLYWFRGAFHGATAKSRVARTGYTVLANKYYFDFLYTDVIVGGVKGPIARASYWFNQNVIDGVVNAVGVGAREAADFIYGTVDQQVVDGFVNGSGLGAEESGQLLRRLQSGKVQQYGALLFGGAVILAGILVFTL